MYSTVLLWSFEYSKNPHFFRFAYLSDGLPIYDGLAKWADNEPNNFMHSGLSDQDGEDAVVHNFNNWKKWNDNRPDDPGFHVVCEML